MAGRRRRCSFCCRLCSDFSANEATKKRPQGRKTTVTTKATATASSALTFLALLLLSMRASGEVVGGGGGGAMTEGPTKRKRTVRCRMYEVSALVDGEGGEVDGGTVVEVTGGWRCVLQSARSSTGHSHSDSDSDSDSDDGDGDDQQNDAVEVTYDVLNLPSHAEELLRSASSSSSSLVRSLGGGQRGGGYSGRGDDLLEIRGALLDDVNYAIVVCPGAEFRLVNAHGMFHNRRGHEQGGKLRRRRELGSVEAVEAGGGGGRQKGGGGVKLSGTSTVLILLVHSPFESPPFTAPQVSDAVFGTSGDPNNLVTQYVLCSARKLLFVPAEGPGIVNGVLEVHLTETARGRTRTAVENMAAEAAVALLARLSGGRRRALDRLVDHCMFAFPPGTLGQWNAEGYYGWYRTLFNHDKILHISYQMHETGHNLGFRHSGRGMTIYGDTSGYQGFTYAEDDAPLMCFNAAKSWESGWYSDAHSRVDPLTQAWGGELVGVVDYEGGRTGNRTVVLRIAIPSLSSNGNEGSSASYPHNEVEEEALYAMYNRAKGFNRQTKDFRDMVTIVRAGPPQSDEGSPFNTHVTSYAEGGLSVVGKDEKKKKDDANFGPTSFYREDDFDSRGHSLVVELCEVRMGDQRNGEPDIAVVVVRLEKVHDLSCKDFLEGKFDPAKRGGGKEKNKKGKGPGERAVNEEEAVAVPDCTDRNRRRCGQLSAEVEKIRGRKKAERFRRKWCAAKGTARVCRALCSQWIDECRDGGGGGGGMQCADLGPDVVATMRTWNIATRGDDAGSVVESPPTINVKTCAQLRDAFAGKQADNAKKAERFKKSWCAPNELSGLRWSDTAEKCGGFCQEYISGCES